MTAVLRLPRPLRRQAPGSTPTATPDAGIVADARAVIGPLAIFSVAAVFLASLLLAGFHSVLVDTQFEVDRLQRRLDNGQEQSQMLRMEVARLESPERILNVAQGRLGMVPPPERVYLPSVLPGDPAHPIPAPVGNPFGTLHR
ncbi:MAG: septum formation initiator family protein [Actinobacteria bacterium]|nr:septum formation initiator family protein [Actinomycetota bacterium]